MEIGPPKSLDTNGEDGQGGDGVRKLPGPPVVNQVQRRGRFSKPNPGGVEQE